MRNGYWRCSDNDEEGAPVNRPLHPYWRLTRNAVGPYGLVGAALWLPVSFDVAEDPAQEGIWTDFSWSSQ